MIEETKISQYIEMLLAKEEDPLEELEKEATLDKVPIILKDARWLLHLLIKLHMPKRILEIGTAVGYSSLVMAKAYLDIERIDTIERNYDMVLKAKKNIEKYGFKDKINVIFGDADDALESLSSTYDMVFIDAAKGHYDEYLDKIMPLLSQRALIVADNVMFKGLTADMSYNDRKHKQIVQSLRRFLDKLVNLKDFDTTIISTLDGMAISVRRAI